MSGRASVAWSSGDLVPVVERLRNLQFWRMAMLLPAAGAIVVWPGLAQVTPWPTAIGVTVFVAVAALLTRAATRGAGFDKVLLRVLLTADAVAVVCLTLLVGGPANPLRYLLVLQVVEVSLLASFRTGMRLAIWQTLLVSGLYLAGPTLAPGVALLQLTHAQQVDVVMLVLVCWTATISTSWMAAANERELRRRRYDLERFAAFHSVLEDIDDREEAGETFVRWVCEEFATKRAVVLLPDGDDGLRVLAARGAALEPGFVFPAPAGSLLSDATQAPHPLLIDHLDPEEEPALTAALPDNENLAVLPLRTEQGRGVVLVEHGERAGTRVERRVVSMVERYRDDLGSRLSTLGLIGSLRTAASTDALTKVANRGRFLEVLHQQTEWAARRNEPLSVMLIDLDHFKSVNDRFGHAAGDTVLKEAARAFRASVRPYDLVARYGGEEFVVLLPGTDLATAVAVADRLLAAVPIATEPYRVTASIGVCQFEPGREDGEKAVARADALLYQAKESGRNRVVSTPSVFAPPVAAARLT